MYTESKGRDWGGEGGERGGGDIDRKNLLIHSFYISTFHKLSNSIHWWIHPTISFSLPFSLTSLYYDTFLLLFSLTSLYYDTFSLPFSLTSLYYDTFLLLFSLTSLYYDTFLLLFSLTSLYYDTFSLPFSLTSLYYDTFLLFSQPRCYFLCVCITFINTIQYNTMHVEYNGPPPYMAGDTAFITPPRGRADREKRGTWVNFK